MDTPDNLPIQRRNVLQAIGGVTAASFGTTGLHEVTAKSTMNSEDGEAIEIEGHIEPDAPNWVYVPFDVPEDVTELHVSYEYNDSPQNLLDIGIFDPDGYDLGNAEGFRGWSGGYRSEFTISRSEATPGYFPGEIESGEWNVIFGPYKVGAEGIDYTLTITMRSDDPGEPFEPKPASDEPITESAGWYRGDLQVHTIHSDGDYTPEDIIDRATENGLDFFVSTDHNTTTASLVWGKYHSADSDLLIIDGEEPTTRAGHYGAIGLEPGQWIDWRYEPEDDVLGRFVEQVHDVGGLAIAFHPFCPYKGCDWLFDYELMDAIEVWNGAWNWADEASVHVWDRMLREGTFLPAVGTSDAHNPGDIVGLPQTVVCADQLETGEIIEGIASGKAYIAKSDAVELEMTATAESQEAGIGEELNVEADETVEIKINTSGVSGTEVTVHTQESIVMTSEIENDNQQLIFETSPLATEFIRVEIRDPTEDNNMIALTNPIFLT